jgi:hypothetical protein
VSACFADLRVVHLHAFHPVYNQLTDDKSHVFLVIGRNDVPGSVGGGCGVDGILVGVLVFIPKPPLLYICFGKLPVFGGAVYASQEAFFFAPAWINAEKISSPVSPDGECTAQN